jgi:hypothetical protein
MQVIREAAKLKAESRTPECSLVVVFKSRYRKTIIKASG